jgi:hypothetical protein
VTPRRCGPSGFRAVDAGADADEAVFAVVVVVDDPAGVVALWTSDGGDGAVSAVAQDDTTIEQLRHGVAGNDDVVAVYLASTGQRITRRR